jgi:hypothetical protein
MSDSGPGESKRLRVFNLAESCLRAFDLLGFFDKPLTQRRQLILGIAGGLSQIQRAIGQQLRAEYEVTPPVLMPMPARLVGLLRQVEQ